MKLFGPCSLAASKTGYGLVMSIFFLLSPLAGRAQDSTSQIILPYGKLSYIQAFRLIERQLNVRVSYAPDCISLFDFCSVHGQVTFMTFFAVLAKKGLGFDFISDGVQKTKMLVIKRKSPIPYTKPLLKQIHIRAEDENGEPLPMVSIEGMINGLGKVTDDKGEASIDYISFPVNLFLSHIDRRSVRVTILEDSAVIVLPIDPQSLEEVSVTYVKTKKALSTNNISTLRSLSLPNFSSYNRLSGISTATLQTMLEGQIPGLLVTQSSGIAGSSTYATIRGQTSIVNSKDPLYILDGVPTCANNQSTSSIQSGSSSRSISPLSLIDPSDIERIDVLKDGDATAIYGSRGANGVILITTRHWKRCTPKLDLQLSTGVNEVSIQPSFMNKEQYLAMRREALSNSYLTPNNQNPPDLTDTSGSFDWGKWLIRQPARITNIRGTFSAGGAKNSYLIGINYLHETMPFPTLPGHDRLTINFAYNHRSADSRLSYQISVLSGWDWNHQFVAVDPTIFQTMAPTAPAPYDNAGRLNFPPGIPYYNPASVIRQPYEANSSNYLFSLATSYRILPALFLKTTIGANRVQTGEFGQLPASSQNPAFSPVTTGYFAHTTYYNHIFEPGFEYRLRTGRLQLGWFAGFSLQQLTANASARTDTGYASDQALSAHKHAMIADSSQQHLSDTYMAIFTSFSGSWNDKYILSLTGRRDRSSQYSSGQRYGDFSAAAAAWVFSKEPLIHRILPFITFGKIKVSEGLTGNNQAGDRTLQYVAGTSIQSFQSNPGFFPSGNLGERNGRETTRKTELSLDIGVLKNRLQLSATIYSHKSNSFLQSDSSQIVPTAIGYTSWPVVLENRGYELSLFAKLADNKNFGWDLYANWTIPSSRLVSFPDLSRSIYADRLVVGQSINVLKGFVYTGVDKQTGLYSFADLNHDGHITDSDRTVVGKFDVTGFGGLDNILRWGNFQLELLIDARIQTGVNYLAAVFANNPPGSTQAGLSSNAPKALLNRWRNPGDNAPFQRLYAAPDSMADRALNMYLNSSALFSNASFLRLRKLNLSCRVPAAKLRRSRLSSLTFFINAQNLLILTPYKGADPELQSLLTLPTLRSAEAGLRLAL